MILEWTNHLPNDEEKARFRGEVISARRVLERQTEILNKKEKALDRSEMSVTAYSEPNWGERQAHKNGYRQCLAEIKRLNDLDQTILQLGD